ncbi:hypothetical protein [Kitasatospora mediocidica]|uniref:hypothetical protein n=1 Tax=Kitasatospora mediocidica TaxID=58352 RepID=UPI0006898E66|nr:hypothetical protein [Kitasatospora mediocidica]
MSARSRQITRAHLRAAQAMGTVFSLTDHASGGGAVRPALTQYLATSIVPWLREPAPPGVRRELLITASSLTYLCGFTHVDDELHGLAQRYYRLSATLADEAGDRTALAVALRALSVQARGLGHHRDALRLAEAAVAEGRHAPPRTRAFLHGQLAVAHAALLERRPALEQLAAAEAGLVDAGAVRDASFTGGYHEASLAHQRAVICWYFGDSRGAVAALQDSLRHRPDQERRSRAVVLAQLAEYQMRSGHLDAACATWSTFLEQRSALRSRRYDRAVALMRAYTRPYRNQPRVRALWQVAARTPD